MESASVPSHAPVRCLSCGLLLAVLLLPLSWVRADEKAPQDAPAPDVGLVPALLETGEFRKALDILERALDPETAIADDYQRLALCAYAAARYDQARRHARAGREALKKLEEQTDASREMARRLTELGNEARRVKKVRDKSVHPIVRHLIEWLPYCKSWFIKDKSRYLADEVDRRRHLKEELRSPHLFVDFVRPARSIYPRILMIESYADEETARKRYEKVQQVILSQRSKWHRHFKERQKKPGYKLVQVVEDEEPHADGRNWVLARTHFGWKGKNSARPSERQQAEVTLARVLDAGDTNPRPEAWFRVITTLDAAQMAFARD